EVMTDKANMEVEAPESGILRKIVVKEGETVPVKELIAVIGGADEKIDDLLEGQDGKTEAVPADVTPASAAVETLAPSAVQPAQGRVMASPRAKKAASERGIDIALLAGRGTGPGGRIVESDVLALAEQAVVSPRTTPLAEKIAAELGVDLSSVAGTGPGGKVVRDDVVKAASPAPSVPLEAAGIGKSIPFSGMRKVIADRMSQSSFTAPHVTLVSEVDMTECVSMRDQLLVEMERKYGARLSYTAIVVKAAALAILDHPIINSSLVENRIIIHDRINIGVATALDNGLIVPVVTDADKKPLHQISSEIKSLADKARGAGLSKEEMSGGTFTVSNLAQYGVDIFNPVINPPESAILGVCRIVEKPAVVDGKIVARQKMNLCLSFDHRVVDGAPAGAYLARVSEILQSPYLLFV
ncbi:MAG: 2-oxo acid dehydrogenase subunit E2, partial [Armatimonadetes bacterium]|nr:2-oxo acid dehydrogenase subunit E2 [Armatimonadota bacterium]